MRDADTVSGRSHGSRFLAPRGLRWTTGLVGTAAAIVLLVSGCTATRAAAVTGQGLSTAARSGPTPVRHQAELVRAPVSLTPAPNVQGDPNVGRLLFVAKPCVTCHQLSGAIATAPALIGPNLNNVALKPTLANGAVQNTPENMTRWLLDPPALKPGTAMPSTGLTEQEARDLTAFLYSQPYNPGQ